MLYNGALNLSDLSETVEKITNNLLAYYQDFDAIIVRGTSGLLVGPPVALKLGVPLVVVRKPDEKSHSSGTDIHGLTRGELRLLFLDDFIATGETFRACQSAVAGATPIWRFVNGATQKVPEDEQHQIVASYSYRDWRWTDRRVAVTTS